MNIEEIKNTLEYYIELSEPEQMNLVTSELLEIMDVLLKNKNKVYLGLKHDFNNILRVNFKNKNNQKEILSYLLKSDLVKAENLLNHEIFDNFITNIDSIDDKFLAFRVYFSDKARKQLIKDYDNGILPDREASVKEVFSLIKEELLDDGYAKIGRLELFMFMNNVILQHPEYKSDMMSLVDNIKSSSKAVTLFFAVAFEEFGRDKYNDEEKIKNFDTAIDFMNVIYSDNNINIRRGTRRNMFSIIGSSSQSKDFLQVLDTKFNEDSDDSMLQVVGKFLRNIKSNYSNPEFNEYKENLLLKLIKCNNHNDKSLSEVIKNLSNKGFGEDDNELVDFSLTMMRKAIKNTDLECETEWTTLLEVNKILKRIIYSNDNARERAINTLLENMHHYNSSKSDAEVGYEALRTAIWLDLSRADTILNSLKTRSPYKETEFGLIYEGMISHIAENPENVEKNKYIFDKIKDSFNENCLTGVNGICESLEKVWHEFGREYKVLSMQIADCLTDFLHKVPQDKNFISNKNIYSLLDRIIYRAPELEPSIIKNIVKSLDNSQKNVVNICEVRDFLVQYPLRKILSKEDIENSSDDFKMILKTSRLTTEEFAYACNNFSKEELLEKYFGKQQKALNLILGQMDKEDGGTGEIGKTFRKNYPDDCDLYDVNADIIVPASFCASEIFRDRFPSYLKKTEGVMSVHDAIYFLPKTLGSEEKNRSYANFLIRNIIYIDNEGKKKPRSTSELKKIAGVWKNFSSDEENLSYRDTLALCSVKLYFNVKDTKFAIEAGKFNVDPRNYPVFEDLYLASLKVPNPFDIDKRFIATVPSKKIGGEESVYTGRFLPRDDVRIGFMGEHIDCCQHLNYIGSGNFSAGGQCAVSTMKDVFSQLFVIENEKKEMVAGAWVWESLDKEGYKVACVDNLEALNEYYKYEFINKITEDLAKYLVKECNVKKVTMGTGFQDIDYTRYTKTEPIALPNKYKGYTDAYNQVLLATNENVIKVDKEAESFIFTRPICEEDYSVFNSRNRVSKTYLYAQDDYYDEEDVEEYNAPFKGFVAVDRFDGIVGVVTYNKDKTTFNNIKYLYQNEDRREKIATMLLREEFLHIAKDTLHGWALVVNNDELDFISQIKESRLVDVNICKGSEGATVVLAKSKLYKDNLKQNNPDKTFDLSPITRKRGGRC